MRPKPRRRIFLRCQRSFPSSAFFQAVTLRFCCRAAESRPRAPLLVTISLYRLSDQAARVNCSSAVDFVPPFKESEATPVARSSLRSRRRNRSAPDRHCSDADNGVACDSTDGQRLPAGCDSAPLRGCLSSGHTDPFAIKEPDRHGQIALRTRWIQCLLRRRVSLSVRSFSSRDAERTEPHTGPTPFRPSCDQRHPSLVRSPDCFPSRHTSQ